MRERGRLVAGGPKHSADWRRNQNKLNAQLLRIDAWGNQNLPCNWPPLAKECYLPSLLRTNRRRESHARREPNSLHGVGGESWLQTNATGRHIFENESSLVVHLDLG